MITGIQPKVLLTHDDNGDLKLEENFREMIHGDFKMNWKLVRERDGLTRESNEVIWIEFDEEGRGKSKHDEPAIGRSLMMSPFNDFFTWHTTLITEILESRDNYLKFRTQNSTYELFNID